MTPPAWWWYGMAAGLRSQNQRLGRIRRGPVLGGQPRMELRRPQNRRLHLHPQERSQLSPVRHRMAHPAAGQPVGVVPAITVRGRCLMAADPATGQPPGLRAGDPIRVKHDAWTGQIGARYNDRPGVARADYIFAGTLFVLADLDGRKPYEDPLPGVYLPVHKVEAVT